MLGLTVADIEFPTGTRLGSIRFRANRYRKLKSRHATRRVRLWPELERRLCAYSTRNAATRMQTADAGRPVSPYTVMKNSATVRSK